MISIILVRPKTPGNIGAIARSMANFDLNRLILIDPQCDHLEKEAMDRACNAKTVLKKAKILTWTQAKKLGTLIATTAKLGTDYNIKRAPITPEDLSNTIKGNIGIVFGTEDIGLTNIEVNKCDFVVSIPASKKYPTMNLSHAATILFYELFKNVKQNNLTDRFTQASDKDKEIIQENVNQIFDRFKFATDSKKETQKKVWKRIMAKAMLTKREAFAVLGLLKKILNKI